VGSGVTVGVSVGGSGVAVGMAACVCATIVCAAATAVAATCSALMVGTGSAPHALISVVKIKAVSRVLYNFMIEILLC